jgi:hypothetical protein
LLIATHADIKFHGIGPQLEGCLKARKGIFTRLVRRTPMPDNQEIAPWRLLSYWQSSLSTRQCQRCPESERDAHAALPGQ